MKSSNWFIAIHPFNPDFSGILPRFCGILGDSSTPPASPPPPPPPPEKEKN